MYREVRNTCKSCALSRMAAVTIRVKEGPRILGPLAMAGPLTLVGPLALVGPGLLWACALVGLGPLSSLIHKEVPLEAQPNWGARKKRKQKQR